MLSSAIEEQINKFPPDYKEEDAQAEVRDLLKQPSEVPESGSPEEIVAPKDFVDRLLDLYMSLPDDPEDEESERIRRTLGGLLDEVTRKTPEPPADQPHPE